MRHIVRYATDAEYRDEGGLRRWSIVDETTPAAVHTGFGVCELPPSGSVPARVQSFEECFYVLDGSVVLHSPDGATLLRPGDYGLLPIGVAHSWSHPSPPPTPDLKANEGDEPGRWAYMLSPQPRSRYGGDTFAVPSLGPAGDPVEVDVRDPRTRSFGHIEPANMAVDKQTQDMLAVSASMRTALLVYSGITVKMMVDSDLGALLTTMFMVQYEPQGVAGPHDHPFEETYLFLEGEVEASFDGESYRLGAGDVAWAGVGCVHGFRNVGTGVVRWLETQAPQPPGRHSYRFVRDWDYLGKAL
jgi:quercetin dioxygenase-like cupin family protein